jgi:hypothetical protein
MSYLKIYHNTGEYLKCMDIVDLIAGRQGVTGAAVLADLASAAVMVAA